MKKIIITVLFLIGTLNLFSQITKSLSESTKNMLHQKINTFSGDSLDGKRHGIWKKTDANGNTVLKGEYDQDIPVNNWISYKPDNTIRKEIHYDSLGQIIEWTKYFNARKVVSILNDHGFPKHIIQFLNQSEQELYELESMMEEPTYKVTRENNSTFVSMSTSGLEFDDLADGFLKMNQQFGTSGIIIQYYKNGLIRSKTELSSGIIIKKELFLYKGKRLHKKYNYQYEKLKSIQTFKKSGELKKTDEF